MAVEMGLGTSRESSSGEGGSKEIPGGIPPDSPLRRKLTQWTYNPKTRNKHELKMIQYCMAEWTKGDIALWDEKPKGEIGKLGNLGPVCFYCKENRHMKRNCPQREKNLRVYKNKLKEKQRTRGVRGFTSWRWNTIKSL